MIPETPLKSLTREQFEKLCRALGEAQRARKEGRVLPVQLNLFPSAHIVDLTEHYVRKAIIITGAKKPSKE